MVIDVEGSGGAAIARLVSLGSAVLLVVGCAGLPTESGKAEDLVMARAQARWDATLAGDFERAYTFTSPSYRALTEFKMFRAQTQGGQSLVSAKIIGVTCTDESCAANLKIEFHAPVSFTRQGGQEIITTHYDERWVKEGGKWWLYLQ